MPNLSVEGCEDLDLGHLHTALCQGCDGDGKTILVARDATADMVERSLSDQGAGLFEATGARAQICGEYFADHLRQGGLGLAMSTASAYAIDVAGLFVQAAWRRWNLPADDADGVELAVHEALSNALVHGNLEVACLPEDQGGFLAHCDNLDRALADPTKAGRRAEISAMLADGAIEIVIRNEGPGYCPASTPQAVGVRTHGLTLISAVARSVAQEDQGRLMILTFAVEEACVS